MSGLHRYLPVQSISHILCETRGGLTVCDVGVAALCAARRNAIHARSCRNEINNIKKIPIERFDHGLVHSGPNPEGSSCNGARIAGASV